MSGAANLSASPARCAACGRACADELGIDPECRRQYGYDVPAEPEIRTLVAGIVRAVALDALSEDEIFAALNELHALGFDRLADRIAERFERPSAPTLAPVVELVSPPPAVAPERSAAPQDRPLQLTEGQQRALDAVRRMRKRAGAAVTFIVGFAGTGKTTMLREIAKSEGGVVVITPTGKAALRVREATGLYAQTIHRWLYAPQEDPETGITKFAKRYPDEIEIPPSGLVLLDEASMVGPDIWRDVWDMCVQTGLQLVCVGDGFQLPPVMPGSKDSFSILTPEFAQRMQAERAELTEILRQALDSPVIRASMQLRDGGGLRSFVELPRISTAQLWATSAQTYQAGGIVVCHKNTTRFKMNAGVRTTLGRSGEAPEPGEPLLVLKNTYEVGMVNGESFEFPGWHTPPDVPERVYDKWRGIEETARFGAVIVGERQDKATGRIARVMATIAPEEIYGGLTANMKAIAIAGSQWARRHDLYLGNNPLSHLHVNLGYAYTAHKSQGSEWPYVLVILEPSVRFDEEEGRRWAYTAITRSTKMAAVYLGRVG